MRRLTRSIGLACMALSACSSPDADIPPRYREVEVPSEVGTSASVERGRALYLESCAPCHGEHADGRGVRRTSLTVPPVDFTNPEWRRSTTPRRAYWRIREGVPGTDMPSWKALDPEQCWDLVSFVLSVAEDGP